MLNTELRRGVSTERLLGAQLACLRHLRPRLRWIPGEILFSQAQFQHSINRQNVDRQAAFP